MKLHNILSFVQGLQEGYVNPYNAYLPEIPDFMGPAPLDKILKELPAVPTHDLPDPNRPDTPQIPPPQGPSSIPDDTISIDDVSPRDLGRLYPDADKARYKDVKLYPDLLSDRHKALTDIDQAYIEFMKREEEEEEDED